MNWDIYCAYVDWCMAGERSQWYNGIPMELGFADFIVWC